MVTVASAGSQSPRGDATGQTLTPMPRGFYGDEGALRRLCAVKRYEARDCGANVAFICLLMRGPYVSG